MKITKVSYEPTVVIEFTPAEQDRLKVLACDHTLKHPWTASDIATLLARAHSRWHLPDWRDFIRDCVSLSQSFLLFDDQVNGHPPEPPRAP